MVKMMTSRTTRRTALTMLGLGSASVVGAETFSKPPENAGEVQSVTGAYDKERWANALEQMAKSIRSDAVSLVSLKLEADLGPDDLADKHTLTLSFFYFPEKDVT